MEEKTIEWRMYGFVPYNISEIQKGIQFGHGVVEYAQEHFNDEDYQEWATYHKTFIILNGGTSSTMLENIKTLLDNGVSSTYFREPDLNGMVSAVVFLVDSRVYDRENYPDFYTYCVKIKGRKDLPLVKNDWEKKEFTSTAKEMGSTDYKDWLEFIGGDKNVFLREYLTNFKLA